MALSDPLHDRIMVEPTARLTRCRRMSDTSFAFGVSEFTTQPWSFDEDVERYAALGVDAIEVVEAKLDNARFVEQMTSIGDAGLIVASVQPKVRTFFTSRMTPEPTGLDDRMACLRDSIERLGKFAPGAPFVTNAGAHPRGDMMEAMEVVGRSLGEVARVAADNGVTVAIEPLSPTSVNVESAIWTIDQALEVIDRSGSEHVGLCLDYWNIWQNADVETKIERAAGRILSVQASDWRTPRSFADRIVPGDGAIPLDRLIAATRRARFDGPYVVEIFSLEVADSLYDQNLADVIRRSRDGLTAAWRAAEAIHG